MPGKSIFSTTVGASVRQTVTALEGELTARSAQALGMSGEEFGQSSERHSTADGFRHTYEQTGTVGGNELFVRIVVDYNAREDAATVSCVETGPQGTVTTATELDSAPRGKTKVAVSGEIPAGLTTAYRGHLRQVFGSVDARTQAGVRTVG
jgi:hypothetical protein